MFLRNLNIPGSALTAQQYRLNIIAQNITNAETTRAADGSGPYKRKVVVFQAVDKKQTFSDSLYRALGRNNYVKPDFDYAYTDHNDPYEGSGRFVSNKYHYKNSDVNVQGGVKIPQIVTDPTPGKMVYDPEHPDANEEGYVEMPNVEMAQEMVDMMSAQRSYEANLQVVNVIKSMASQALNIGR